MTLILSKGAAGFAGRERASGWCPSAACCRRSLRARLAARGRVDAAAPLFVGRGGVPLPRRTIQQLVRRLARVAGITEAALLVGHSGWRRSHEDHGPASCSRSV